MNHAFGEVVRRLRTKRGWSLDDLANATGGLAKSYLWEMERGTHSPTLEVQLRLELALGVVQGGLLRLAHRSLRKYRQ